MNSKTPQFDALIAQYYQQQKPETRTCAESGEVFSITESAYNLYKELSLPLPTVAPHIRLRRLRAHIGGIELFPRKTIHDAPIISMYDPESPAKLLSAPEWYADSFQPMQYGRPFDVSQPFFPQWDALSREVPREAIITDPESQNCNWSLYELAFKNSYATFGGVQCDSVMYADMCIESSHSVDVAGPVRSEWCYEGVQLIDCSHTFFSEYCIGCLNMWFSRACKNCSDCFGCINISKKKYCFFNEQLIEDVYKKKMAAIDLSDADVVAYWKAKAEMFWQESYTLAEGNSQSEDVRGEDLLDCSKTFGLSMARCNRMENGFDAANLRDCCDMTTSSNLERCANGICITDGYENKMSMNCFGCIDMEYSAMCLSCEHCFGCVGLTRKKFCIFNVEYSEEEYWKKVEEIKCAMLRRGEYGEFFPYRLSLLAYNTSHADAFFPLSREEALKLDARWYEFPKADTSAALGVDALPKKLSGTGDDIPSNTFICPSSGRPFRIIKPELDFHCRMNIALPRMHPSLRRKKRYRDMMELKFYPRSCMECKKEVLVRVPPSSPKTFLCASCYERMLVEDRRMAVAL